MGARACAAIRMVWRQRAVVQRCQWHKRENVVSLLPRTDLGPVLHRTEREQRVTHGAARVGDKTRVLFLYLFGHLELRHHLPPFGRPGFAKPCSRDGPRIGEEFDSDHVRIVVWQALDVGDHLKYGGGRRRGGARHGHTSHGNRFARASAPRRLQSAAPQVEKLAAKDPDPLRWRPTDW